MDKTTILIVDDDREIVDAIAKFLSLEGYSCIKAYDGIQAVDILVAERVQLIILDIMMPNMDGLSALIHIRQTKNIPIIMLSAKAEDSDKIIGLSMGADDYITKPFSPQELVARVKSQLRRYIHFGDYQAQFQKDLIVIGGLEFNCVTKEFKVDGEAIKLTATEMKILDLLMRNAGQIFSAEEIYERVWREEAFSVENTVMVHIRRIREKIEINPREPKYLKVVWGIGYKIERL